MREVANEIPLASIASLSVALQQLFLKQALPVVGTVADATDVHVFKMWGEVWRFKSTPCITSRSHC